MARYEEFQPWRDAGAGRVSVVALFLLPLGLILGLGLEISTEPWYVILLSVGAPTLLAVGLLFGGMRTTIEDGTLIVQARPFLHRRVALAEVEHIEPLDAQEAALRRARQPGKPASMVYALPGRAVVELRLKDGALLRIGSADPARFVQALREARGTPPRAPGGPQASTP